MTVSTTTATPTTKKVVLHWFRHGDLRVHDNPALTFSANLVKQHSSSCTSSTTTTLLPVFCFDTTRVFGTTVRTPTGSLKCGLRRAQFVRESVADLRNTLRERLGCDLLVTKGEPATVLASLLETVGERGTTTTTTHVDVVLQEEVLKEERDTVKSMQRVLQQQQQRHHGGGGNKYNLHTIWGSTLYDRQDLPYNDADDTSPLSDMPDVFTPFRNKVEKHCKIQTPLPIPSKLPFPSQGTAAYQAVEHWLSLPIPTLPDLGYTPDELAEEETVDPRGVLDFRGGETAALARLQDYIWGAKDLLRRYFDTRNGMIGADYSTKLSPWLAHGCVSPRRVAAECQRYEVTRGIANKSTYWVVFELLWRDFCKFLAVKHGDAIFYPRGITTTNKSWPYYEPNFTAWTQGKTGYPLVDANMRELKATGFMSNRGRQNVASFLALDCGNDWRAGGNWFETYLLDYDVYSNWVNWCAAAGMTGGRVNKFNIVKQSKDYDQHGDYVRLWLPELKDVPTEFVHEPWKMTQFQQKQYNVTLGVDYPHPIVRPSSSRGGNGNGKQRKPYNGNRNKGAGQKYEMKSLKAGSYNMSS